MTQDEIIEMARQAKVGSDSHYGFWIYQTLGIKELEAFAKLVAAKEREACADIAENWRCNGMPRTGVANEIRARGEA